MSLLMRVLGSVLLGLLIAAPVPAVGAEAEASEPIEALRQNDSVAVPQPLAAHAARVAVTPVLPASPVRLAADRSTTLPVRLHVLHCVWRE